MSLQGKTPLADGAAKGIGRAIAFGLAKDGADIVIVGLNQEKVPKS
jgi:meso-butanediol dehydrogenase/(S,S)-butanediol dehydrogenase/diacetyl reductase